MWVTVIARIPALSALVGAAFLGGPRASAGLPVAYDHVRLQSPDYVMNGENWGPEFYAVNARGLNNVGQVVGVVDLNAESGVYDERPAIWGPDGRYELLPALPLRGWDFDEVSVVPAKITDAGEIYGTVTGRNDGDPINRRKGVVRWASPGSTPALLSGLTFDVATDPTPLRLLDVTPNGRLLLEPDRQSVAGDPAGYVYNVAVAELTPLTAPVVPEGLTPTATRSARPPRCVGIRWRRRRRR